MMLNYEEDVKEMIEAGVPVVPVKAIVLMS